MTERLKPVSAMAAGITAAITSFFAFIETPYIYHSQACSTALAAVGPIEKGSNHVPAIAVAPKALRPELSGIR
jgi:hypothetical protein